MTNSTLSNPWFGISMGLIGIIVGYGAAMTTTGTQPVAQQPAPAAQAQPAQPSQPPEPTAQNIVAPDPDSDHIRGDAGAAISLIEYSDFECPFCQRHHPTMQQALDEYGDDVNWVYRHFPLSFHPNAKPAAVASECVAELGGNDAFWEFADLVFERGSAQANYPTFVEEIGLDTTAFQTCFTSGKYDTKIDNQMNQGSASGVRGTPGTIVYNNETQESKYISGAQPYSNVKAAIDSLL